MIKIVAFYLVFYNYQGGDIKTYPGAPLFETRDQCEQAAKLIQPKNGSVVVSCMAAVEEE